MVIESLKQSLCVKQATASSSQAEAEVPISRSCEAENRTAGERASWWQQDESYKEKQSLGEETSH